MKKPQRQILYAVLGSFLNILFCYNDAIAKVFECEKVFSPTLQVEEIAQCNSSYVISMPLLSNKKSAVVQFNNNLFDALLKNNNLGGIKVKFPGQKSKIVYRSSYLAGAPLCIQSLAFNGVKTIINLYDGNKGYAQQLYQIELVLAKENDIENYTLIRDYLVNQDVSYSKLNQKIIEVIHDIANAKGDVLIHCYTGEHDTGVIFGVLNKCINNQPLSVIKKNMICHMDSGAGYGIHTTKRAYDIIEQFPCDSL